MRGAFNTMLSAEVPEGGRRFAGLGAGNHGAAVAHAASTLGHAAKIFVPHLFAKEERLRPDGAVFGG